ncbi:MAG: fasciclin domain-containing protein [Bacteroidaceae bacterium]|nr:fasciclin domain-containing protein [Bacteroidaceae bacterium]
MNSKIFKNIGFKALVMGFVVTTFSSCYEEPDTSQIFNADQLTIEEILCQHEELSAFNAILAKCSYDKKISTYLEYTCFAPINDGVSQYLDSLYNDENKRFPHNGIKETPNFTSLSVLDKVALMSDSLCEDISKYHLSGDVFQQINVDGATTCSTLITGRSITANTFDSGKYAGMTSLNGRVAITQGDIEASNGILHICSGVIPRSDRTIDDQMGVDGNFKIFHEALQLTGLDKMLQQEKKDTTYTYAQTGPTDRDGIKIYCPEECLIKWTIFAETDDVFKAAGINSFADLKAKCAQWYGNCASWYDYVAEKGISISTGDDYTNEFNVVHMFVAYHILRAGMAVDKIVYEKNAKSQANWNICFGYDPQEYFETLLPNTLMKVWELNSTNTTASRRTLLINRYRKNNTLTDEIGTFGSDATHPIIFPGVEIDRSTNADGTVKSIETLNGYIHRIKSILIYDQNAKEAQNERMRLDSSTFLYELINNGIRFASPSEISTLNGGGDGNRVAFDNTYFDNIYCYNPSTLLRFCVMGAWRSNNSDQFQGWDAYDFAIKLPHVPTGTYELRIVYPPMGRGGLMQFYLGNSSNQADMVAQGIPFDACADPTQPGNIMGCEQIFTAEELEDTDYGLASDQVMKVRGYMRAPASFSRGTYNTITDKLVYDPSDPYSAAKNITGSTSCRSEWGYGTMMLRYIICTQRFEQSKDYWLRIKNLVNDANLGWSFDFIELCPVTISNNQTMSEDWY